MAGANFHMRVSVFVCVHACSKEEAGWEVEGLYLMR